MKNTTPHGSTAMMPLLSGLAAGLLFVTMLSAPAMADDASDAQSVSALISDVAPSAGKVAAVSLDPGNHFTAKGHRIPRSAADPVVVAGKADDSLEVRLPSDATSTGEVAGDGTVVYSATDGEADVAVQALESGKLRIQTVINDEAGPHEFSYAIGGGYQPVRANDGTFWVHKFDRNGEIEMYSLAPAWARDANGADVKTHYEVRGSNLVQVVTPDAKAVYPIVADPTWEWYNAAYGAGFSKSETRDLASAGSAAAFCLILGPALAVPCGIFYGDWILQANLAKNAKGCVFIAAVPAPIAMRWISSKCK